MSAKQGSWTAAVGRVALTAIVGVLTLYAAILTSLWLAPPTRGVGWTRRLIVLIATAAVAATVWRRARTARQQLVTIAIALVLLAPIPLWGYWHSTRYGTLHVTVHDAARANDRQVSGWVTTADLEFQDAAGVRLAKGTADNYMTHPTVGDCRTEERQGAAAYGQCYDAQSRWFMTWVRDARRASVRLASCTIENVPVAVDESKDMWWLWWVPHPHLDNTARTHFQLTLWVDSAKCAPAPAGF